MSPEGIAAQLSGSPLLLLLDIDGTLCELMPHASAARVPPATCAALESLARRPGVYVALVTGRSVADAERIAPVAGAHVHGNHGIEWRAPDGTRGADPAWAQARPALREAVARIAAVLAPHPGAWLEDKEYSLTVHVRGCERPVASAALAAAESVATELGLRTAAGKEVLNIVPPGVADKGSAVLRLVEELGGDAPTAAVLFAGDDVTDEDAFRALREHVPHAVTVHVGPGDAPTAATTTLPTPDALAAVLATLVRRLETEGS